jgi:hypothetical protein
VVGIIIGILNHGIETYEKEWLEDEPASGTDNLNMELKNGEEKEGIGDVLMRTLEFIFVALKKVNDDKSIDPAKEEVNKIMAWISLIYMTLSSCVETKMESLLLFWVDKLDLIKKKYFKYSWWYYFRMLLSNTKKRSIITDNKYNLLVKYTMEQLSNSSVEELNEDNDLLKVCYYLSVVENKNKRYGLKVDIFQKNFLGVTEETNEVTLKVFNPNRLLKEEELKLNPENFEILVSLLYNIYVNVNENLGNFAYDYFRRTEYVKPFLRFINTMENDINVINLNIWDRILYILNFQTFYDLEECENIEKEIENEHTDLIIEVEKKKMDEIKKKEIYKWEKIVEEGESKRLVCEGVVHILINFLNYIFEGSQHVEKYKIQVYYSISILSNIAYVGSFTEKENKFVDSLIVCNRKVEGKSIESNGFSLLCDMLVGIYKEDRKYHDVWLKLFPFQESENLFLKCWFQDRKNEENSLSLVLELKVYFFLFFFIFFYFFLFFFIFFYFFLFFFLNVLG